MSPAKDIVLVLCPGWITQNPQLSLPLLKSYLKSQGLAVQAYDFGIRMSKRMNREDVAQDAQSLFNQMAHLQQMDFWEQINAACGLMVEDAVEELLDTGARTFGFSCYSSTIIPTILLARKIKESDPSRTIICGGPYWTGFDGTSLGDIRAAALEIADAVVPGEGEKALGYLLDTSRGGRLRPRPGAFTKVDGQFMSGGPADGISDLNSLPFPDFSDYNLADYESRKPTLPTYMTRGCIRRCVFCDVHSQWGQFLSRSAQRVFDEIQWQRSLHPEVTHFWICDSILNADMKGLGKLCDLLIGAGRNAGRLITWQGYAIVRGDMTPEFTQKMARAGCTELMLGIESGSQKILHSMRKGVHVETAANVLRNIHAAGIKTHVLLMTGFPGEGEDDFDQTISFLRHSASSIDIIGADPTMIDARLPLYQQALGAIDAESGHPVFWRSRDGGNDYAIRLRRIERLCREAEGLGIAVSEPLKMKASAPYQRRMLGEYSRYRIQSTALALWSETRGAKAMESSEGLAP